jgi:Glycosyl transferase family 2
VAPYARWMSRPFVPQVVVDLAHARREARARGDWAQADGYRAEIEAAGWVVVDRGVDFDLRPARPADVVIGEIVRHGSSASVPSRLGEAASGPMSLVVVVDDTKTMERLASSISDLSSESSVVLVADGLPTDADETVDALERAGAEVIRLASRTGPAEARNAGCRRATGSIVAIVQPGTDAAPAAVARDGSDGSWIRAIADALVAALADPGVAIAGTSGLVSTDMRHFEPAPGPIVDAVTGLGIAFRRTDFVERGPFEERFRDRRSLDIWFSLVLRDEGPGAAPRRAVAVEGAADATTADGDEAMDRDRARRRDGYRILDRFGRRLDLLGGGFAVPEPAGD